MSKWLGGKFLEGNVSEMKITFPKIFGNQIIVGDKNIYLHGLYTLQGA